MTAESSLRALFDFCKSQPISLAVMDWGYGYGGISGPEVAPDELLLGELNTIVGEKLKQDSYAHDPFEMSELQNLSCSVPELLHEGCGPGSRGPRVRGQHIISNSTPLAGSE